MDYLDLIIDEYKKRQEQEQELERPYLELPLPETIVEPKKTQKEEPKRVIIIEL